MFPDRIRKELQLKAVHPKDLFVSGTEENENENLKLRLRFKIPWVVFFGGLISWIRESRVVWIHDSSDVHTVIKCHSWPDVGVKALLNIAPGTFAK